RAALDADRHRRLRLGPRRRRSRDAGAGARCHGRGAGLHHGLAALRLAPQAGGHAGGRLKTTNPAPPSAGPGFLLTVSLGRFTNLRSETRGTATGTAWDGAE